MMSFDGRVTQACVAVNDVLEAISKEPWAEPNGLLL